MAPSWPHSEPPPTSFDWHHINWAWISHISCGSLYHILQTNINFSQDIYLLNFQKKINLIKILLIFKSITNLTFKWIFKNHYHIVQALMLSLSLKFNERLWRFHLKRNPLIIASLWLKDTVLRFLPYLHTWVPVWTNRTTECHSDHRRSATCSYWPWTCAER